MLDYLLPFLGLTGPIQASPLDASPFNYTPYTSLLRDPPSKDHSGGPEEILESSLGYHNGASLSTSVT